MVEEEVSQKILCPTCRNKTTLAIGNPYRPFCCERCKLIDLGAWAAEEYKIPTPSQAEEWEEKDKE